ncbi:MAG TPA: hypothetical protein VK469_15385, partial [Candidatus Kapabacteria bacterium]|nr:hypothetical protein [Candidatus Kapabacteria bacterium]
MGSRGGTLNPTDAGYYQSIRCSSLILERKANRIVARLSEGIYFLLAKIRLNVGGFFNQMFLEVRLINIQ